MNNEHYDAIKAYVDKDFLPVGIFTFTGELIQENQAIQKYFLTKKNQAITQDMVMENSKRSPSKARYKVKNPAPFYLFYRL